jgi:8-amino-7-oxononanoate synthase
VYKRQIKDLPIDFCSNDYLGLSRSAWVRQRADLLSKNLQIGSTGSRLLTGQNQLFIEIEDYLATTYQAEAALLFNSGFDANTGLLSTVIRPGDVVLFDEAVHASIHQGIDLSGAEKYAFRHNDITHLEELLINNESNGVVWIVAESYYSMDGDQAPLQQLEKLSRQYNAHLIIDEAHALGCFGKDGRGLCMEDEIRKSIFARVITFGKGMGYHGAAVLCSQMVKEYLINFCKPFIYTTALPPHSLSMIQAAHEFTARFHQARHQLQLNIRLFMELMGDQPALKGTGPVFAWMVPGEAAVRKKAADLQALGVDIRPIVAPTVPAGTERLRISMHSFNSKEDIRLLTDKLKEV